MACMVIMSNIVVLQQLRTEIKEMSLIVRKSFFVYPNNEGADQTAGDFLPFFRGPIPNRK